MEVESDIQEYQLLTQSQEFKLELLLRYTRDKGWIYFGGHHYTTNYDKDGFHNKRFHRLWPRYFDEEPHVEHADNCVCGTSIVQQCYIYNTITGELVVVGNCCILKFKLQGMTCDMCQAVHRNRSDNYCSPCRLVVKKQEADKELEALKATQCIEEGCMRKRYPPNKKWAVRCKGCWFQSKRMSHW